MIFATHHYLAQITLSDHAENQNLSIQNIVLVSNDPISADIQQAFVRNHIISRLNSLDNTLTTQELQTHSDQVRYTSKQHQSKDDDLPFAHFEVKAISKDEAKALEKQCAKTYVDLDFLHCVIAVKFEDDSIRVTAMLKPNFHIVKDGEVTCRIFSKHVVNGSVSSITMGAGITKIGLSDFAKVQSQIALLAKNEEPFNPIVWASAEISECLHGESARSYACA